MGIFKKIGITSLIIILLIIILIVIFFVFDYINNQKHHIKVSDTQKPSRKIEYTNTMNMLEELFNTINMNTNEVNSKYNVILAGYLIKLHDKYKNPNNQLIPDSSWTNEEKNYFRKNSNKYIMFRVGHDAPF